MSRFEGPRGLIGYAEFETPSGQRVEVQESSAVLEGTINGPVEGPFVWLRVFRSESGSFAHLTVRDATELRDALNEFLADFHGDGVFRDQQGAIWVRQSETVEGMARAWDEGARHVYTEGGRCSFARDGDPCPYNPYRTKEEN